MWVWYFYSAFGVSTSRTISERFAVIGQSQERLSIDGQSQERLSIDGQSQERLTVTGSTG